MQRTFAKYMCVAFGLIGVAFLIYCINFWLNAASDGMALSIFVVIGFGFTFVGFGNYLQIRKFEEQNFAWYKKLNPQLCGKDGQISCNSCESTQIRVRGLMQKTYTREHFCGACGTTLYYSPEG